MKQYANWETITDADQEAHFINMLFYSLSVLQPRANRAYCGAEGIIF